MGLKIFKDDNKKYRLWPITITLAKIKGKKFFDYNCWQIDIEVDLNKTWAIMGQTLHCGPIKILFGHK